MHESLEVNDDKFADVMRTAILTAYPRTFSDIPYAQEIFDELSQLDSPIEDDLLVTRLAPEIEARSKLIDRLLAQQHTSQVLELAAKCSVLALTTSHHADELSQVHPTYISAYDDARQTLGY